MNSHRHIPGTMNHHACRRVQLGAALLTLCVLISACAPSSDIGQTGLLPPEYECNTDSPSDSLIEYARKCKEAVGEDVPQFNCNGGTLVPETNLNPPGASYGNPALKCDRPNVLNHKCDPGSMFQVLKETPSVAIVGHCRKKGLEDGNYGDIAVIQYNKNNGATCFYQALGSLPAEVSAPSDPSGTFPWLSPHATADISCVGCHNNGPFIRSPYLAQLKDEPKNRLPGTNEGPGPWDQRFTWNSTLPYAFVGSDFQSWKVYSVSVEGTGSMCTSCHRLGYSYDGLNGGYQLGPGTAQDFAKIATAKVQEQKNPHSANSPIWMTPGQTDYITSTEEAAQGVVACAEALIKAAIDPNAPPPPAGCQSIQFGQGNTCVSGPISGVINGATQSTPTNDRTDISIDIGACTNGDCPISFCYWKSVHGPFWQTSPSSTPIGDAEYRGSFIRLYGEDGMWKVRAFSDPTDGPATAPPGGKFECTRFNEIVTVPDSTNCGSNYFSITDPDGTHLSDSVDATVAGAQTADVLSGLIGNIAQANGGPLSDLPDVLRVYESGGKVALMQSHTASPPSPLKPGPLTGEAWINACGAWTADYFVKNVYTTSDILLAPAAQAMNVRCFITGVTGAWSSTRDSGTTQPFAEIYVGQSKDIRLRVSPVSGADRVGAYASCIRLK